MKNKLNEFRDYISKLGIDATIDFVFKEQSINQIYSFPDDYSYKMSTINEFFDTEFLYDLQKEYESIEHLTFLEHLAEMVTYNEEFDINTFEVSEENVMYYNIFTRVGIFNLFYYENNFYKTKDEVIPFLNETFPEQFTNLLRKERLEEMLNGPD